MRDGVAALINAEVIDKAPTSKKAMQQVQNAFNQWRRETGFTNAQISKILALSIEG
jgi:3-methyladenine DNA glycosylase Tag